ncbi:monovalent cation/H+ antiporter complex subunit F [Aeromicrobium sp. CTD01-1L150]|uniref:monovalent cation/H+ antiporter complex subunit F n=1 Tax=Aeromicrobium sp. CTD01-1L150 TaxID=3341830 RepID=UPI0035BF897A
MNTVGIICGIILGLAGALCLVRIVRGPTMLDRTVATDVFVAITIAAVGVEAAVGRSTTTVPVLLALALVAFLGSVSIARFAARDSGPPSSQERP